VQDAYPRKPKSTLARALLGNLIIQDEFQQATEHGALAGIYMAAWLLAASLATRVHQPITPGTPIVELAVSRTPNCILGDALFSIVIYYFLYFLILDI